MPTVTFGISVFIPKPIYILFCSHLFHLNFGIDLKTANLSSNGMIFSFIQISDSKKEERMDENMHNVMMADGG